MRGSFSVYAQVVLAALAIVTAAAALSGCVTGQGGGAFGPMAAPTPIQGNSGAYMSPYTQSGQLTDWARSGIQAGASDTLTSQQAYGAQATGSLPTGSLGKKHAGMDRPMAAESAGGMDFIREHSDMSFRSAAELCAYLRTTCANCPNQAQVLVFTRKIYPEMDRCQ